MSRKKVRTKRTEFTGTLALGSESDSVRGVLEEHEVLIDASSMDGEAWIPGMKSWDGYLAGHPAIAGKAVGSAERPVLRLPDGREGPILVLQVTGNAVHFKGAGTLGMKP